MLYEVITNDESADVEQLLDELEQLQETPVPVNNAVASDFASLFFLSPMQVEALLAFRDESGPILSSYELASVEGFTEALAELTGLFLNFDSELRLLKSYNFV